MAFKDKQDIFGIETKLPSVKITSTTQNKSVQTVEAKGEDGFVVANEVFGENEAPSCDGILIGDLVSNELTLGEISVVGDKSYCLSDISISTGAGSNPTLSFSGTQVEDGASAECVAKFIIPSLTRLHHAQNFGVFSISGQGAHLTQSSLNIKCTINPVKKDGVTLAHDITDGRVEVSGTIQVSDASYSIPTIEVSEGWVVTSPLTETNGDSDFPTYTFTLTKFLTATHPDD